MTTLSALDALAKRQQLLRDGYCIVPGTLYGELLERRPLCRLAQPYHLITINWRNS